MAAPEGSATEGSPLHRKVQAGRATHQARAMSLAKALRLTLAKVADDMFEMSMAVIGVRSETCAGEKLADHLAASGLLMLLDGPMRTRAAVVLDASLVGALIQQQTMGKVLPQPDMSARDMTQTDAAISAPFVNALLERAAPVPEDPKERQLITGFAFGAWVENLRLLCMALEAEHYELIHLSLDIAGGVRQGQMTLCMPAVEQPDDGDGLETGQDAPEDGTPPSHCKPDLSETVLNLHADLRIALTQRKMTLRSLSELEVGSTLELGNASFDQVRIQTLTGAPIGRGILGQLDGVRAVQVDRVSAALPLRRRGEDRESLDLPDISKPQAAPARQPEVHGFEAKLQQPDASMNPDRDPVVELPELPDMSDLPEFDEGLMLPALNVG